MKERIVMSNKRNQKVPVHTSEKKNSRRSPLQANTRLTKGIAVFALGTFMTGGILFLPADAQQETHSATEPVRDTVGILTKQIDKDSIELNVEGTANVYRCAGEPACQEEISSFKLGSGLLIQFTEADNNSYTIQNMEALYEPETDEIEKVIKADYHSMPDRQTIKVYINNEPHLLPLQDYLHEQEFDSQFAPGAEVTLLIREDIHGKMTVGAVNEL
jgi:hypothetical protein